MSLGSYIYICCQFLFHCCRVLCNTDSLNPSFVTQNQWALFQEPTWLLLTRKFGILLQIWGIGYSILNVRQLILSIFEYPCKNIFVGVRKIILPIFNLQGISLKKNIPVSSKHKYFRNIEIQTAKTDLHFPCLDLHAVMYVYARI